MLSSSDFFLYFIFTSNFPLVFTTNNPKQAFSVYLLLASSLYSTVTSNYWWICHFCGCNSCGSDINYSVLIHFICRCCWYSVAQILRYRIILRICQNCVFLIYNLTNLTIEFQNSSILFMSERVTLNNRNLYL